MSVGLGNIWRFPFIANRNGGGAFLIPYLVVLTVIGRPMYYMEMALGQFSSRGNIKMYEKLCPVFKGIIPVNCHKSQYKVNLFLYRNWLWATYRLLVCCYLLLQYYGHYSFVFHQFIYERLSLGHVSGPMAELYYRKKLDLCGPKHKCF